MNIDELMDMLDWNQDPDIQEKGVQIAKGLKTTNAFVLPADSHYNKNVWENCAKIVASRSDKQLTPYIGRLLEWMQDLNWPGALIIFDRLLNFQDLALLQLELKLCKLRAMAANECGLQTLMDFEAKMGW